MWDQRYFAKTAFVYVEKYSVICTYLVTIKQTNKQSKYIIRLLKLTVNE